MSAVAPSETWRPVALSRELRGGPLAVVIDGAPVVLFRDGDAVRALPDRCPHRMVELSGGRVLDGEIECPYHGWRFGGDGRCTAVPGLKGPVPAIRVPPLHAVEHRGAIHVARGRPAAPPSAHPFEGGDVVERVVRSSTRSTVLDAAENILDATHTHYTHKGLLRGLSAKRFDVTVDVTGGPDWVEAVYTGEPEQQGLVSRLLEGERTRTVGRFRAPGIAELEYWGPRGLALATTFHLREAAQGVVEGIGWLVGPRQGGLGHLKALLFEPLFHVALRQDQRVLRSASLNAARHPGTSPVIGPLDILRRDIAAILRGEAPDAMERPRRLVMSL